MLTIAIILFAVCFGLVLYSFCKKKAALGTISLTLTFLLPLIGSICCLEISCDNLPDGYEFVPSYYVSQGEVICAEKVLAQNDGKYYVAIGGRRAWWIPGAPFEYEEIDVSERRCESCDVICSFDYCVLCGTQLNDSGCRHENYWNMPHCGSCGEYLKEREN